MNNIYWNRLAAFLKQHHLPCKDLNIVLGFTYGMEMVSVLFIDCGPHEFVHTPRKKRLRGEKREILIRQM